MYFKLYLTVSQTAFQTLFSERISYSISDYISKITIEALSYLSYLSYQTL